MDETHDRPALPSRPYITSGLDALGEFTPDQLAAVRERRLEMALGQIRPRVYEGSGNGRDATGPSWVAVGLALTNGEADHQPRPLTHVHHHAAPGQVSWGYGGSGPADLALSIVVDALEAAGLPSRCAETDAIAWRYHQGFKSEHVATWPQGGPWVLTELQVLEWLAEEAEGRAATAAASADALEPDAGEVI